MNDIFSDYGQFSVILLILSALAASYISLLINMWVQIVAFEKFVYVLVAGLFIWSVVMHVYIGLYLPPELQSHQPGWLKKICEVKSIFVLCACLLQLGLIKIKQDCIDKLKRDYGHGRKV